MSQTLATRGNGLVVTVYSERRMRIAVDVAVRLAGAFAGGDGPTPRRVGLATDTRPASAPRGVELRDLTQTSVVAIPDLMRVVRDLHDVTVIAPDEGRSQRAFLAMELADHVVLPSDRSVAGIRSTQRVLQLLASLGCPYDKLQVVLYDTARATAFSPADAAQALQRDVYFHAGEGVEQGYGELVRRLLR